MEDNSGSLLVLTDWKKEEKFQLLQALSEYGCNDIEQIQNFISTKSLEEVKNAITYYRNKASQNPAVVSKRSKRITDASRIPIARWAKLLTDSKSFEDLKTETSLALRLIAEFEDTPPLVCTDKIDFKNIYYLLANALEGKPLPSDVNMKSIFENCVVDVAKKSKTFINPHKLKGFLNSINMDEGEIKINTQISSSNEVMNVRYLACQKQYNPLNIPEEYLKFSS